jgi:5-methylcytosine-specific restriction endonuclease McrA
MSSKSPYFLKNFEYNGGAKSTTANALRKFTTVTTTTTIEQKPKPVKKKDQIPKKVKEEVWNKYIGDDIPKHLCLCCKLNRIKMTDFQVGHVLSEKDGGTLAISNLRPICASCNHSMGSENMLEYAKKYEFIIG